MTTTDPGGLSAEQTPDPGEVSLLADRSTQLERLDRAIAGADDDGVRGSLLLDRAIAQQGEADPSIPAADSVRAFELLSSSDRSDEAALAAAVSGAMWQRAGNIESAVDYAVEAMALVDIAEPTLIAARAANSIAIVFAQLCAFEQASDYSNRSLDICAQIGQSPPTAIDYTACYVAVEAHHAGVTVPLGRAHEATSRMSNATNPVARRILGPGMAVELRNVEDPELVGRSRLDDTLLAETVPRLRAWYRLVLAIVAHHRGDDERSLDLLDAAIPSLVTVGDEHRVVRGYRLRSAVRASLGDPSGALEDATAVAEIVRRWHIDQVGRLSTQITRRVELEQKQSSLQRRAVDLVRQINIDEVTKTGSRRLLEARLDEIEQLRGSASIVVVDIDDFKGVNDDHGHTVGDAVLAQVGKVLRSAPQPWSVLARYGGDEFIAVFSESGTADATAFATDVMASIERTDWAAVMSGLTIQVSAGIAAGPCTEVRSVLERADRALYSAKRTGRNRFVVA